MQDHQDGHPVYEQRKRQISKYGLEHFFLIGDSNNYGTAKAEVMKIHAHQSMGLKTNYKSQPTQ